MLRGRNNPAPDREDSHGDATDDGATSRWTKAGTVCAVIFGAIMLSSIGIIVWGKTDGGDSTTTGAGQPPAAGVPATGSVPTASSTVGAPAPNSTTPGQVTWLQVGYGALPFSVTAGPAAVRAGVPSGFAHTRAGAVQASIQILGRLSWSAQTKTSMKAVANDATTPAAEAVDVLSYGPPQDPSVIPQVAGFQVVTYSSTEAVVNVALRFNGALRVSPATVQWVATSNTGTATTTATTTGATSSRPIGGDWKLAGAPGPLSQTSWAQAQDLTGYTLYSGQPTKAGD